MGGPQNEGSVDGFILCVIHVCRFKKEREGNGYLFTIKFIFPPYFLEHNDNRQRLQKLKLFETQETIIMETKME